VLTRPFLNTAYGRGLRTAARASADRAGIPEVSEERSEEQAASVFGNLPASRPGTRSPRRGETAAGGPELAEPAAAVQPQAVDRDAGGPDTPPSRTARPQRAEEEPGDGSAGLEDLAWAGVAVAAEAATLGVRLATRAVEALRAGPRR